MTIALMASNELSTAEDASGMDKPRKQFAFEHGLSRSTATVLRSIVTIMLLGGGSISVILFFTQHAYTVSGDLASHYSLIEFIVQHWALPGADVARLGPMAEYPPGAHVLAAVVHSLFGVNVLRVLFFSSIAAIFALYLLVINSLGGQNRNECFIRHRFANLFHRAIAWHAHAIWQ